MTPDFDTVTCSDRRIARVLSTFALDLTQRPTLTEAARIAGLAPTYFSKCFRRRVGMTFVEWSARIRVKRAKTLLRIADLSITAVAASVGYRDVTTFERVFRRAEKVCPREYRRSLHPHDVLAVSARDAETKERNAELMARNAETMHKSHR